MRKENVVSNRILFLCVTALLALSRTCHGGDGAPANAPEEPEVPDALRETRSITLDDIVVTAEQMRPHDARTIELRALKGEGPSSTVEGLLDTLTGIDLSRRSLAGSDGQRLRIRGFDESRSLVLLNGRSLHGAGVYGGYYVDWASLGLEGVDRIEVIRGITPAKYGNTLGGVVDIIAGEGIAERRTEISVGGGSLETTDVRVSHAGASGRVSYSLAAGRCETDGYLRNASMERTTVSGRIGFALAGDVKLRLSARHTENESGMIVYNMPDAWDYDSHKPDSLDAQLGGPFAVFREHTTGALDWGDGSGWKDERLNLGLDLSRNSETFDFSLRAYLMDQDREERFYAIDDRSNLVLRRDSEPEKNNWGWRLDFRNSAGGNTVHTIEYGLEGNYLGYGKMTVRTADPAYFFQPPTDSPSKSDPITQLHGVYLQDLWRIGERARIQAGVRLDSYRADGPEDGAPTVDEDNASPKLSFTVEPAEGTTLTTRFGRAYRFPTNPEYYWWYAGFQPPARDGLTSEKATQYEVEIERRLNGDFVVAVRGYRYRVDDYLRTIFGYMPSRVVYNIDWVELTGLELEIVYRVTPRLRVWGNFTRQNSEKHGDILDGSAALTDELTELPDDKGTLGVSYLHEAGFEAELRARYTGDRETVRGNLAAPGGSFLAETDDYLNLTLRMSWPLCRNRKGFDVRMRIAGENLLDEDIVEEFGYPLPGRTVTASVTASF